MSTEKFFEITSGTLLVTDPNDDNDDVEVGEISGVISSNPSGRDSTYTKCIIDNVKCGKWKYCVEEIEDEEGNTTIDDPQLFLHEDYKLEQLTWAKYQVCYPRDKITDAQREETIGPIHIDYQGTIGLYDLERWDSTNCYDNNCQDYGYTYHDVCLWWIEVGRNEENIICGVRNYDYFRIIRSCDICDIDCDDDGNYIGHIKGRVFHCTECEDFDLCEKCYDIKDTLHDIRHNFVEYDGQY
jgi:hypothetical protein